MLYVGHRSYFIEITIMISFFWTW